MEKTKDLTAVQARVVREIMALVRRENRVAGDAMPEISLAQAIGTSRSPVQVALRHLATLGVVRQDSNRRFVLARDAKDLDDVAGTLLAEPDDPLYHQIAQARQSGELPNEVNEAQLMRMFGVARSTLRKVLSRIAKEGWVEQRVGSGWEFLPMIDSPQAYEESYLFRQSIEPAALMSPWFSADRTQLAALRREQQLIVDGGYQSMTAIELFEANCRFHETLAQWSGNRFALQTVQRLNQLRRLVEYRQAAMRPARQTQAREHLGILAAIEQQDLIEAAGLMRKHLEDARRAKVYGQNVFAANAAIS
ncbi:GntR family transcriptional regulator [Pigmentiphaga sp. NML080357]|uniref:GntR family transcriptional regulator n=1 Tax=Pigmentiphaga sp. NML080357 TaxID=2008675 RepID=UPI000B40E6CF|nr:GntR family transcriptional regulator [Pigmentiphaga sp. NML080357]OVZ58014.1 GntR family transcriptional regulator [Pigmentiphaga sp. NML080357]